MFSSMARELERQGVDSTLATFADHPFGYDKRTSVESRWIRRGRALRAKVYEKPGLLHRLWYHALADLVKGTCFLWCLLRHDVFVLAYGTSFSERRPMADLGVLKFFRKRIICIFVGTDHRPSYLDRIGYEREGGAAVSVGELVTQLDAVTRRVALVEKHADIVVANPLSSQFHLRHAVNIEWFAPYNRMVAEPVKKERGKALRIVHAPSWPEFKGSDLVAETITQLRAEGREIEFTEIKRRPNHEVLALLAESDLAIDQMFSDRPMAGFAAESLCQGVPCIVGGYGWPFVEKAMPPDSLPPTIRIAPDDLAALLREVMDDPARLERERARIAAFVASPYFVEWPQRVAQLVRGDVPREWFFEPGEYPYALGGGLHRAEVARRLAGFVAECGPRGLHADHFPAWRDALLRLASSPDETVPDYVAVRDASRFTAMEKQIQQLQDEAAPFREKLENFRGMIARRDEKIAKKDEKIAALERELKRAK